MKAVLLAREEKIDFLLAVGGGSVLDGTKFIAAAIPFVGDPWDILAKRAEIKAAIPLGSVLTLPATGSEMNCWSVISHRKNKDKLSFGNALVYPKFAILDPETTFSLPVSQTANGIVDAFVHVLEQYYTYPIDSPVQDRFAEGVMLTLLEEAPKVLANPLDYEARANIMWAATQALNGILTCGVAEDWTAHMLGHELTAAFGIDHGATLAILTPVIMQVRRQQKREKLLQYAARVFGITSGNDEKRIDDAIKKTYNFFASLGMKMHLSDYGVKKESIALLLSQLERHGLTKLGESKDIDLKISEQIYLQSL